MKTKNLKAGLTVCFLLLLSGCFFGRGTKNEFFAPSVKVQGNEGVMILPTVVIKEISTGKEALESMYDTKIYTDLKSSGINVQSAESLFILLKEKNWTIQDLKKIEFMEIDSKIIQETVLRYQCKYFVRMTLMAHIKEELMSENYYFIAVKLYSAEGRELGVVSVHFNSEESVSSSKIFHEAEDLIQKLIKRIS